MKTIMSSGMIVFIFKSLSNFSGIPLSIAAYFLLCPEILDNTPVL